MGLEAIVDEIADCVTNAYLKEHRQLSVEEADHIDFLFKRAESEMEEEK